MERAAHVEGGSEAGSSPPATSNRFERIERRWYRGSLTLAYVAAPPAALALGALGAEATEGGSALGLAGLIIPASVHWAHGNGGRGALSIAGQAGSATVGVLAGVGVARLLCDPEEEERILGCLGTAAVGGTLGGLSGYAGWAVLDVAKLAYEDVDVGPKIVGMSVAPVLSAPSPDASSNAASFDGAVSGMRLSLAARY